MLCCSQRGSGGGYALIPFDWHLQCRESVDETTGFVMGEVYILPPGYDGEPKVWVSHKHYNFGNGMPPLETAQIDALVTAMARGDSVGIRFRWAKDAICYFHDLVKERVDALQDTRADYIAARRLKTSNDKAYR
jgi:hypothetical protein